jgi:hypothetical protein
LVINSPWGGPFVWKLQRGPMFTARMLSAVLAGLIVSGALLLLAERKLRGSFLARCGIMVALCAGGATLEVFLHASIVLLDEREPMPQGLEILCDTAIPTVAGASSGPSRECILAFLWRGCWGSSETGRPRGRDPNDS